MSYMYFADRVLFLGKGIISYSHRQCSKERGLYRWIKHGLVSLCDTLLPPEAGKKSRNSTFINHSLQENQGKCRSWSRSHRVWEQHSAIGCPETFTCRWECLLPKLDFAFLRAAGGSGEVSDSEIQQSVNSQDWDHGVYHCMESGESKRLAQR